MNRLEHFGPGGRGSLHRDRVLIQDLRGRVECRGPAVGLVLSIARPSAASTSSHFGVSSSLIPGLSADTLS